MKNRNLTKMNLAVCSASALATFLASQSVFAAGFEKSVFWSGHYSALAGAAQSSVTGPEALYWNPAGLAGSEGLQIGGDFSPTLTKFSGNVPSVTNELAGSTASTPVNSNTSFSPIGAAFVSYGITPQWGVGVGYDVIGGTRADYDSVNFGFPTGTITATPPLKADLTLTELSIGTGYEALPGLKFGASYRVTFVHADLDVAGSSTTVIPGSLVFQSTQMSGLSQTDWNGFKVGMEYAPKDSPFGFGATWRSRVNFSANSNNVNQQTSAIVLAGPGAGTVVNGNGSTSTSGNGNVGGTLPMRIDAAAHYAFASAWTGFLGYSFSNYSQDQALNYSGTTTAGQYAGAVPLVWNNMTNIRGAVEYTGFDAWPVRFGYVWTSQVTPNGDASPVLASPGTGNTFILGTGHKITPNLTIDGAFEYSRDSGSVAASDLNGGAPSTATGDYTAKAYALHLGATLAL